MQVYKQLTLGVPHCEVCGGKRNRVRPISTVVILAGLTAAVFFYDHVRDEVFIPFVVAFIGIPIWLWPRHTRT